MGDIFTCLGSAGKRKRSGLLEARAVLPLLLWSIDSWKFSDLSGSQALDNCFHASSK